MAGGPPLRRCARSRDGARGGAGGARRRPGRHRAAAPRPAGVHERLAVLATESGVDFIEIMLNDDRTSAVRRFTERASRTGDPAHVEAAEMLARLGGVDELVAMYDRLEALVHARPWTAVIHTVDGQEDLAYRSLMEALTRPVPR